MSFDIEFLSFWISRSFDLGDLGDLKKCPRNVFKNYIFEISAFHWSKCTIVWAIRLNLISKSAQARGAPAAVSIWWSIRGSRPHPEILYLASWNHARQSLHRPFEACLLRPVSASTSGPTSTSWPTTKETCGSASWSIEWTFCASC